jgi:hypothetical protein
VTVEQFLERYPEYQGGEFPGQVALAMADAALNVSAAVWGTLYEKGVGLLAAHYLAVSPMGRAARLESVAGRSTYLERFEELRLSVASGGSVA